MSFGNGLLLNPKNTKFQNDVNFIGYDYFKLFTQSPRLL